MKTFSTFIFRSALALVVLFVSVSSNLYSQPQYYNFNSGGATNSFPFNIAVGKRIQLLYLPGEFAQPTPAPAGNITTLSFRMAALLGPFNYTDVVIKMGRTDITSLPAGDWYPGPLDTVYSRAAVSLSAAAGEWLTFALDRPFTYNPEQSLVIDIQQCGAPGASGFSTATTTLTGSRRNASLVGSSCPFPFANQSVIIHHTGINITPASCNYTWNNQTSGTTVALRSIKAVSDMVVWAAGTNGAVRKTTDGGTTWTDGNPNPGVINGLIYNITAIDANTAWCTTSPANTFIYKTTNGGANWTEVFTQTAGFINVIEFTNSTTGFAQGDPVGGRWSLWKTIDAGSTWDSTGLYLPQAGTEAGWVNSMSVIGNNIWFGTNNTAVYKSTNFGNSWTSVPTTGLLNSYSVHFNSVSLGLAGGTAIVKTTDGGLSYASVGTVPGTGNINAIEGRDNDFWYIRGTGIFRSTDAGSTWTQAYTVTGTGNDMDFPSVSGCLIGWSSTSTGLISRMTGTMVGVGSSITEIPEKYGLDQNYPNPFNPVTNINFNIPKNGKVTLRIFDVSGKEVATLINEDRNAGSHKVLFDGSNFASGTYFYTITVNDFRATRKMILVK